MGGKASKERHSAELQEMKREVDLFPNLIASGIRVEVESIEDQVVIKYKDLQNPETLEKNVDSTFKDSSELIKKYVLDTATDNIYQALGNKSKMKEINLSYHSQSTFLHEDQKCGLDVHYCVRGTDQSYFEAPEHIELLIIYKIVLCIMAADVEDFVDQAKLEGSKFDLGRFECNLKGSEVDIRSFRSLVLGEICFIPLTHKGGIFPLHPFGLVGEECSAELTAPEGVVAEGVEVSVEYAVLLGGPFKFPRNWQRVSVVMYLNCPQSSLLSKPITLKLRHWAVLSEDSSLCFVKASHVLLPNESEFVFTQVQNKNMFQFDLESASGLLSLQDQFCLCGICDKVETVSCDKGDIRCCGMLLEEPMDEGIQRFFLYIMYDAPEWISAFKKYCSRALVRGNYLHDPETLVCKSDKSITATVEKTEGFSWLVTISKDTLQYSDLKDNLSSIDRHYKECEDKIASLREAMYPPSIKFTVTYARLKSLKEPHVLEPNHVRLKSAAHYISFQFTVYSQDSGIQLSSSDTHSTLKSKPNESEMLLHLGKDMSADWEMFAVHLNIDPGVRDQVNEDCQGISKRCLLQVVKRWLQEEEGTGDLPRTWSSVVSAVEKCGYGDLAARLKDMYIQSSSTTE